MKCGHESKHEYSFCPEERFMAKGIEKGKKNNKPKVSTKEKQKRKKEKNAAR